MTRSAEILNELWAKVLPMPAPPSQQFELWLQLHRQDVMAFSIIQTAKKFTSSREPVDTERAVRFCSGVANYHDRQREGNVATRCAL